MKLIAFLAAFLLAAPVPPELVAFYKKWPRSTRELGQWARGSPKTASLLFGWAGQSEDNLLRAREFVIWLHANRIANPYDFADQHKDWQVFERLRKYPEEGLDGFVEWCRKHKFSCQELFALDAPAIRVARGYALKKATAKEGTAEANKPADKPAAEESAGGEKPEGEKPETEKGDAEPPK